MLRGGTPAFSNFGDLLPTAMYALVAEWLELRVLAWAMTKQGFTLWPGHLYIVGML